MDVTPRRARSLAEFGELGGKMFVGAEIGASIASYRPRDTDVVITPFAKCGTTWLQQIFHTLRTRGDMDFDDISRVVPWIETAMAVGVDLNAPQRAEPRGFKSHLPYTALPRGPRYIVALRDPRDALVSFYRFMEGWFLEPGAVSLEEMVRMRLATSNDQDGYWRHLNSWWAERDNPRVLILSYEHMTADPEGTIRKVAAFCGIPLDDALLALTLERSSLAYMLAHKDRFDDAMMRRASEVRCNLPPGGDSAKVRKGGASGRQELSAELVAEIDAKWAELTAPAGGFPDYAALEAALRART
ncbi:MAG: sulfotransferase domain-containing protein [Phenylobacterium sp.]|uniref:sulfotransferase domain-containing protein n=1 Tax=Phenylobacterium sp. TaxID=1871053 RepID=UPI001B3DDAFD|nr:sulfotransferase domain-containing protein [Phenylobacterium sp.]MBP7650308.1 sulfotransferase domain-containing protein [Phenylobacterium sp.]MBP7817268.1 sulfotransferase domain-containing protein [Phenylobacterium sp.]MBP9230679.1 sulfotransferase domain-containing protein [Phenylobacterium sp.]MBP9754484.1 sulfotransferase domain-containing protein [Phenylobacterium sp.]